MTWRGRKYSNNIPNYVIRQKNNSKFEDLFQNEELLCQFIRDPTSLKLPVRVSLYDPVVNDFYKLSRDLCFLIDKKRKKLLKEL